MDFGVLGTATYNPIDYTFVEIWHGESPRASGFGPWPLPADQLGSVHVRQHKPTPTSVSAR